MPDQSIAGTTMDVNLHSLCEVCDFKKWVYFRPLMSLRVYSHRFLVFPGAFHSCWKLLAFDRIQIDACCTVVWRRFEATFKLRSVIPIFERNEMTGCPWKPRQPTSIGITLHIQPLYIYIYVCVCVCVNIYIDFFLRVINEMRKKFRYSISLDYILYLLVAFCFKFVPWHQYISLI